MISQSGILYKIIVTLCVLLGVNQLSLSSGSAAVTASNGVVPTSLSHAQFNLQYPPTGLYFTAGDIAAAESGSFFGDGAVASHPLHGLLSGASMDLLNTGAGGNQYVRALVPAQQSQLDDLQTAGQSYFIEPPAPTTTTQKPSFKKRKTRRPISELAEKSKRQKAAELDNTPNNELFQGNHVPFNPFRQIVNTSFGRKRPSDNNKQERSRSRAKSVHQETGSVVDTNNNDEKSADNLNEIQKTEGEPRVLGRRRPASDVRPIRPATNGDDSSNSNAEEPQKGRRFPLRRPRPNFDAPSPPSGDENAENTAGTKPARPRNFVKRPRPRPTTTIAAPATETDNPTEITTDPVTVSRPLTTQTAHTLPVTDARPRVRPARPLGVSRFANNVRFAATTTPSSRDSENESVPSSLPPSPSPRRRPLRPTTRQQSLVTSTEAPEDILANHVTDAPASSSRGRGEGAKNPLREGRQGFILRPRPTPVGETPAKAEGQEEQQEQEVGIRKPLSNRRRKRPTTTAAAPASPAITYNQEFTGGVVENNVIPSVPTGDRANAGRRTVLRTRPTPLPALPATGAAAQPYQIQEEQTPLQPALRGHITHFGNPAGEEFLRQTPLSGPSRLRRPVGASIQSPSPIQHAFDNNNAGLVDPSNFVNHNSNFFQIPSQESFFSGGLDNVLGVPSNANFRSLQQRLPGTNEFSSRTTIASDEPEIGHSDFSPAASTEKQSVSPTGNDAAEIADAPVSSDGDQENKEAEEAKKPPVKLSPLERLQQNRQAAARKFLSPRKPTEKTTVAPATPNKNIAKNFRKSLIPPRMLRPRGKLPGGAAPEEKPVPNDGSENDSGAAVEEKSNVEGTAPEIINDSAPSAAETDKDSNTIPISPVPKAEEKEETTTTRKPSILEAAKRRRASSAAALLKNSGGVSTAASAPQPQQQKLKITPAPPPAHNEPETPAPACEDNQRYSKFLKRCVTMYKPKAQG